MVTEIQELQGLRPKSNSSSSSSTWKDFEVNDNNNSPRYTSLNDILDESPPRSFYLCFDANNEFDPSNITIKNKLVRRAASVYMQSSALLIPRNDNCLPAFCEKLKSRAASAYSWWRLSAENPIRACSRPISRFIHNLMTTVRSLKRNRLLLSSQIIVGSPSVFSGVVNIE